MKIPVAIASLLLLTARPAFTGETSLSKKHVDVTIQHIKKHGPDFETANIISGSDYWSRRQELVALVAPHLTTSNPDKVVGALETLYRLRGYQRFGLGDFEKENAEFFGELDQLVHGQLDHLHRMKSDRVYKSLALYLGGTPTLEAKRQLLRILESPFVKNAKSQALIGLAWHRDSKDMATLLPCIEVLPESNRVDLVPLKLKSSWSGMSPSVKKRIRSYCYSLGISSTGRIQLIGFYRLTEPSEFGEKGDGVFHFLQQDLFGSRLFWSILVNVDSETTRVLYHVNAEKIPNSIGSLPAHKSE